MPLNNTPDFDKRFRGIIADEVKIAIAAPAGESAIFYLSRTYISGIITGNWGHSSAGRALAWHARGRGFESHWLH